MWSAFFKHLKLAEIYLLSRLINCQLIPGLFDYDCMNNMEKIKISQKYFDWNCETIAK